MKTARSLTKQIMMALFALAAAASHAAAELSPYEIDANAAKAYSDAYAVRDIEAMRPLLADDAIFEDPSSYFEGKDAIIEGLSEVFKRVTSTGPETREINKYRSGSFFVYTAWIDFNMMMPVPERPAREFNFKLDFMLVLKVENGKVVEHRDYLDTEAFIAQLQAQMAEASAE